MDREFFVQNVKQLCESKNLKRTNVFKELGLGGSFLNDVQRGQTPAVDKVQKLAVYLGVTTSQLLGEDSPGDEDSALTAEDRTLLASFHALNGEGRERLVEYADDLVQSGKYGKKADPSGLGQEA